MTMTTRMLPLAGQSVTANIGTAGTPIQRSYSATAGGFIDALGDPASGDAASLSSQNFLPICASGPTSARPIFATSTIGVVQKFFMFLDTTISKIVVWDGANWRDPVTGATA